MRGVGVLVIFVISAVKLSTQQPEVAGNLSNGKEKHNKTSKGTSIPDLNTSSTPVNIKSSSMTGSMMPAKPTTTDSAFDPTLKAVTSSSKILTTTTLAAKCQPPSLSPTNSTANFGPCGKKLNL